MDALINQPTRRRLLTLLGELDCAASTGELAERLKLHPNGVRAHLRRLRDAGLVEHLRAPRPRGRPRDEWALAAAARPDPPQAYVALAGFLARSIAATPERLREVEATGREIGRELARDGASFTGALAALGFRPRLERGPGPNVTCRIGNCPYRDAVRVNGAVVCALHRGIAHGLLAPEATLLRFTPRDPDAAGCEIEIGGMAA